PLADSGDVHLAPLDVKPRHGGLQQPGVDERHAPVRGRLAVTVEIRIEDPGCEVLDHAVLHDLHRGGPEPPHRAPRSPGDQLVDLLIATVAVPPPGAHAPAPAL